MQTNIYSNKGSTCAGRSTLGGCHELLLHMSGPLSSCTGSVRRKRRTSPIIADAPEQQYEWEGERNISALALHSYLEKSSPAPLRDVTQRGARGFKGKVLDNRVSAHLCSLRDVIIT